MSSYTRRRCPAHSSLNPADAATAECTCGIRAAAHAAIAVRPIPKEAIRAGATVAASIALRHAGLDTEAKQLLSSSNITDRVTPPPADCASPRSEQRGLNSDERDTDDSR